MTGLVRFASEALGVELWPGQRRVVSEWEASGRRKAALVLGRRSGKSLMSAIAALHNAVAVDYSEYLRPGEARFILIVATREAQAAEQIRTCRELLMAARDSDLHDLVEDVTSLEIRLRNGVTVRAMPANSRATRGYAASMIVMDELAHFISAEEGAQAARSVWRALTPSVRQFGSLGRILITSTPLGASGLFFDLVRAGETGTDPDLYVARAPTWEMNPSISRSDLAGEFAADPQGAEAEYAAQFVSGHGAFLDPDAVHAAVVRGRRQLPPRDGLAYTIAIDPAFAESGDHFALGVAHPEGVGSERRAVIDHIATWRGTSGPLSSDAVLDEVAEICASYRVRVVQSDQYAVVPVSDGLRRRGVTVRYVPATVQSKADAYSSLRRGINLGLVSLLDDPALTSELVGLRSSPTPTGKPRIAAASGLHDDRATVCAACVFALLGHVGSSPSVIREVAGMNEDLRAPVRSRSPLAGLGALGSGGGIWGDAGRWPL